VIVRGETEEDLLSRDVGYLPTTMTTTTTTRSDDQR
jgi:hypothetical protein